MTRPGVAEVDKPMDLGIRKAVAMLVAAVWCESALAPQKWIDASN